MTLTQVWGALLIVLVCPVLGSLPTTGWITRLLTGKQLAKLGTGNVSVSAAFYHGGTFVGVLSVLTEALKGILAVLLARAFFPTEPVWELIALIALVVGRYWGGRGAGTTNVVWGYVVHDWKIAGLTFLIGGIGFTLIRNRQQGKYGVLVLLPLLTLLLYPSDEGRIIAAAVLSLLMAWIYQKIPDDLEMTETSSSAESRQMFRFLRGDRSVLNLDQPLDPNKVGQKAATLSQLRRWGYPVPMGWILLAGDDPAPMAELVQPTGGNPVVVRSSAVGEDSETASAAGLYESILNVSNAAELESAIARCLASYNSGAAMRYRQDRGLRDQPMAALVQRQIDGAFSGVAFSRDPITRQGEAILIEALPGGASRVVSGRETPEQYRVWLPNANLTEVEVEAENSWILPDEVQPEVEGTGDVPPRLIQQVAFLARHLEARYHGIPQDIEWTYDGQQLWILQTRPITTLLPIWTRKIAAEVIPGLIHPLTWSINQPLTCGVWGDLFRLVLGKRSRGLDFDETATLHFGRAYFNASLLGQIFRRMGLPPESLEFLTRGAAFSKPPLTTTLSNLPGLLRLLGRELKLNRDFRQDQQLHFQPNLTEFAQQSVADLTPIALLTRIEKLLDLLRRATYYSILAPLSFAVRQSLFQVEDPVLDNSRSPEVASLRSLRALAKDNRSLLVNLSPESQHRSSIFATLAENPDGQSVLAQIDRFLEQYGYLSEVGTDIAVPTWKEDPRPVRELFAQFLKQPQRDGDTASSQPSSQSRDRTWQTQTVQRRLDLKGQVTEVYSRLLAELRWSFVALEQQWLETQVLSESGDIFFLELDEVRQLAADPTETLQRDYQQRIALRRDRFQQHQAIVAVSSLVYGYEPTAIAPPTPISSTAKLQGIGASPGWAEGTVKVLRSLQDIVALEPDTILVVPYTDSGWAPLLAQVKGLIAEVGGRLSHGAIVAREYGIPAVMNISEATYRLQDGQRVRIDGQQGTVEILPLDEAMA